MNIPDENIYEDLMAGLKKLKSDCGDSAASDFTKEQRQRLENLMCKVGSIENLSDREICVGWINSKFRLKEKSILLIAKRAKQLEEEKLSKLIEPPSEDLKAEAEELLRQPTLLEILSSDIEKSGLVGERINAKFISLCILSSQTKNPQNSLIKGGSSAGKNHLIDKISPFFPSEWIYAVGRLTPQALFYVEKDALKNRCVIIQEAPGAKPADYSIRIMESDKKLIISTVEKIDGKIATVKKEVEGPVSFITTTTNFRIFDENENRQLDIWIDESEEQTERIHTRQAHEKTLLPDANKPIQHRKKLWQTAFRLLKPCHVIIPFAPLIEFPKTHLRMRRDKPKLLELIQLSAFFQQETRKSYFNSDTFVVEATVEDYAIAVELSKASLDEAIRQCSKACLELVQAASEFSGPFSKSEIMDKMGCKESKVEKALKEAKEHGLVREAANNEVGFAFQYVFVKFPNQLTCGLLSAEALEEKWKNHRIPTHTPV